MRYAAPHFSLELPDDTLDASSYGFVFPAIGGSNPARLSVVTSVPPSVPDLETFVAEQQTLILERFPEPEILESITNVRGSWSYAILKFTWGESGNRMCQKDIHLFVSGQSVRYFHFLGVAPLDEFARAEPAFDRALGTLKVTGG